MRFAHSLGYPHCDLMLAELTASQLFEVYAYFKIEQDATEESRLEEDDRNLEKFFELAERRQRLAKKQLMEK
jgi:hypothetical protein